MTAGRCWTRATRRSQRRDRALTRTAGGGRFLGALVRPLPRAGSNPRGDRGRTRRRGAARQDQRGREPRRRQQLPGAGHPRSQGLPQRRGGERVRRRAAGAAGPRLLRLARAERRRPRGCRCRTGGAGGPARRRPAPPGAGVARESRSPASLRLARRDPARRGRDRPRARAGGRFPRDPVAARLLAQLTFADEAGDEPREALEARLEADPDDAEAHYRLGCLLAADGEWRDALEHLLATVRLDRGVANDGGRLRMLDAFVLLGDGHELTRGYRQRLTNVIF